MKNKDLINDSKKLFLLIVVLLLLIGGTYAWLTTRATSDKVHIIKAGNLKLVLDDTISDGILISNAIPVSDREGLETKAYTFTLENLGSADSSYTLYLDDLALDEDEVRMKDDYVKYSLTKNGGSEETAVLSTIGENPNRILQTGTIAGKTKDSYTLRVWINKDAENDVMKTIFYGKIRVVAEPTRNSQTTTQNKQIEKAYLYNPTSCITGEEETCAVTTCYENKSAGSCPIGTILKIKVNEVTSKYFHILHDDGQTMTLQQRENTVYNTPWYETSADNTKGPLTILQKLEDATNSWDYVNTISYTMGTTSFGETNAYTGCSTYNSCTKNSYVLGEKKVKARMITMQEAKTIGCTGDNNSCPIWMNNYLQESSSNGATVDDTHTENDSASNAGYWTMQASSANANSAWRILQTGRVSNLNVTNTLCGARAVIEIEK